MAFISGSSTREHHRQLTTRRVVQPAGRTSSLNVLNRSIDVLNRTGRVRDRSRRELAEAV